MAMPNFPPVMRGVPKQQGQGADKMLAKMDQVRRMAQNTGATGAAGFVPGSACAPNWNQPEIERNANGCPTSWNGCGDYVSARFTIPAAPAGGNLITEQLITAPFQMVPRILICSGTKVDAAGNVVPIEQGDVVLTQAKTANSGTSVFGADQTAGIDLIFFRFDSFFDKFVNFPVYANQPAGIRTLCSFVSTGPVTLAWTEVGQSAHMLPGYED